MSNFSPVNLARLRALLPEDIALKQAKWEFAQQIARAREAGANVEDIAGKLGLSRARVYQIDLIHWLNRHRPAPLTAYLDRPFDPGAIAWRALPS